jgi:hypothetical protein
MRTNIWTDYYKKNAFPLKFASSECPFDENQIFHIWKINTSNLSSIKKQNTFPL